MAGDKKPQESKQELLDAFVKENKITLEQLDAAANVLRQKLRKGTHDAVVTTVPQTKSTDGSKETVQRVPFAEAAEQIEKAGGPNLKEALREKALRLVRWGDLEPTEVAAYEAKFNAATINVAEVLAALQAGRALRAHFDLGDRGHAEHFKHRIDGAGVRTREWSEIDGFHKIDAFSGEQVPEESTPRVAFSDDTLGPPRDFRGDNKSKHADHWLKQTQDHGAQWLTPQMWMDDFRARADDGLRALEKAKGAEGVDIDKLSPQAYKELLQKTLLNPDSGIDQYLPDTETATIFPEHRNASGRVLGLYWHPSRVLRYVDVFDCSPGDADTDIGPRPALGKFPPS